MYDRATNERNDMVSELDFIRSLSEDLDMQYLFHGKSQTTAVGCFNSTMSCMIQLNLLYYVSWMGQ